MPLGFWPLPGYGAKEEVESAKKRFDESYFGEFEGVWCECFFHAVSVNLLVVLWSLLIDETHRDAIHNSCEFTNPAFFSMSCTWMLNVLLPRPR